MNIEYVKKPATCDIDFITEQINQETSDYGEAYPFAFFIRDDNANIIAGANGFVIYGVIYTDQLWVHRDYRGQGIGGKIMNRVHEFGKSTGCKIATLQTMSFQNSQSFYETLGYVVDFNRSGYVKGSHCIFMKKTL